MDRAERLARIFHERYEALAPFYGYQTRPESAVDWERVPEANRRLMVHVCRQVLTRIEEGELDDPDHYLKGP